LAKFMEVLGFFLLPTSCSHNLLETYFAWDLFWGSLQSSASFFLWPHVFLLL
jgi:hypothetical protein